MASLDGELLEPDVTCSFRETIRIKLEALVLGMHFDMSILS